MVDGKVADSATTERPLDYIQGENMLIPALEAVLEGKEEGDRFEATIQPEEGYGEYDPRHCFDLPKESFEINGVIREDLLVPGRIIPMYNGAGELVQGIIVEVKEDGVTVDFNHPMAGKVLNFTGTVLSVREATEKEITEGLHGEFLPQEGCHGGCGGNCGGGCGGNCGGDCGGHEDGEECGCGGNCGCGQKS